MNRIRELREEAGMTQRDLAALIDCKPNTVHYYETDKHVLTVETIARLCSHFGVTADYLLGFSSVRATGLSEEEWQLVAAWRAADADDRSIVDLALRKYKSTKKTAAG